MTDDIPAPARCRVVPRSEALAAGPRWWVRGLPVGARARHGAAIVGHVIRAADPAAAEAIYRAAHRRLHANGAAAGVPAAPVFRSAAVHVVGPLRDAPDAAEVAP